MAEIEHFCDPNDKSHSKFNDVSDTLITLYSACHQMDGTSAVSMKIGEAVQSVSDNYYCISISFWNYRIYTVHC